jgi:protein-S-isoprenylcysteine O-methyltransferase Ste14
VPYSDSLRGVQALWTAFALLWLFAAVSAKRTVRSETLGSQLKHRVLVILAYLLLFTNLFAVPFLQQQIIFNSADSGLAGLLITILGLGLAVWARFFLGRNWSATVTMKQNHQFISSGPYAFVRHPIYSGLLLALLGTAIVYGQVRSFLAVLLAFIGWWLKSRTEEEFLCQLFNGDYIEYRRRVKALIPFLL